MLAYREHASQERGVTRPNVVKPETAHPAFDKACHLFGIELRRAPVDPETTLVDVDWVDDHIDDQTVAIIGSACNYGYGTVDPIAELSDVALGRGVGLHVDSCLGGFILPFGQELGYDVPVFDYRVPGVTSISADTHKYGYALKGTSVLTFRDRALRNAQYFFLTDWSGGKYCSPGMEGSRSGGLLAATWASMVHLGREGYREPRPADLRDRRRSCRRRCVSHPELRILGRPDLPVQLHLRRLRRVPRQRLHAPAGMAAQRPAVPQRPAHGGDPTPDPGRAWPRPSPSTSPTPWPTPIEHKDEQPRSGAIYGGVAGRHDRRGRRLHQGRHGRHDGRLPAGPRRRRERAPRHERFVLAVDLGTGGPKVGLVSLTGHVALE